MGKYLKYVIISSLILLLKIGVNAQQPNLLFDHLSVENGLSQSTIFSIIQDKKGFVWIATRDGLNRYDSHEIKVYRNITGDSTSLPNNQINCVLSGSDGILWIGTAFGLCIYKPETDDFIRLKKHTNDKSTISSDVIHVIFEDRDKNIWIGTREGLNLVTSINPFRVKRFYHKDNNPNSLSDNFIRTIYQDRSGNLWLGHNKGLSKLINKGREQLFERFHEVNFANALIDGAQNELWIGTEHNGLLSINLGDGKIQPIRNTDSEFSKMGSVRVLVKEKDLYWIGTLGGLYTFNPSSNLLRKYNSNAEDPLSLSDNSIRAIYFDRNGSLWVGTFYGGVNFYSPMSNQFGYFKLYGNSLPLRYKNVSAIYEDYKHNLWFGIDGGGLISFDKQTNTIKTFVHHDDEPNSISSDIVKSIFPDGRDGLWIGTFRGLDYYSFKTRKFTSYPNDQISKIFAGERIYDLKSDKEGTIWLATNGNGLWKLDKRSKKHEKVNLVNADGSSFSEYLSTLLFDSQDRLWIGSSGGLAIKSTDNKLHFDPLLKKALKGKTIQAIYEDSRKKFWIGTRGNGLYLFDEEKKQIVSYTISDGLPGKNIVGILEGKNGILWLSTENGLSKFDTKTVKFRNFGKNDGLICKEFNANSYFRDHSGKMFFGGYNGIVIFNPDSILENTFIPPVVFTKLRLFNDEVTVGSPDGLISKPLEESKKLKFKHNQNVFSIQFAVLNYINPGKNLYAYKLEGFEKEWNISDKPTATYMNLKPGKYTFLAKGSNNDGEWNNNPISIDIIILPPPWKSWWAFFIYGLVIITGLLYFRWQLHIRFTLERNLYIEQMENKKQTELHQAKLQFFTNISHDLRTPLMLIISPIENLIKKISGEQERNQLRIVHYNANRLLKLINQLLDFRKQETQNLKIKVSEENIINFLHEIHSAFEDFAINKGINMSLKHDSDLLNVWFDREELGKVFYNLLSNAIKFTPKGGDVSVIVQSFKNYVEIIVEDTGPGIPKEHIDKVFNNFYQIEDKYFLKEGFGIGLAITKGIIELHHGKIFVESISDKQYSTGTRFTIQLLLGKEHFQASEIGHDKTSEQIDAFINLATPISEDNFHNDEININNIQVLLVEDNVEIRRYIKSVLDNHYFVIEADNGSDALRKIQQNLPDIIISDVMMPVMDGIDLTKKLKSDDKTKHIPVILITAKDAVEYQLKGLETGADEYIIKPFHTDLLELKIRNLIHSRESFKRKFSKIFTVEPKYEALVNPDERFMERLMNIIESHMSDPEFNVSRLVELIGMSRPVLFRKVKALTDMSVMDLIKTTRLKKAAMLLKQKKMTISEVGYSIGFSDSKYFSKAFRNHFGKSPSEFTTDILK